MHRYPAMVLLPFFAFPALTEYFKRHYVLHSSKLEPAHRKDYETLANYVQVRRCRSSKCLTRAGVDCELWVPACDVLSCAHSLAPGGMRRPRGAGVWAALAGSGRSGYGARADLGSEGDPEAAPRAQQRQSLSRGGGWQPPDGRAVLADR